MRELDAALKSAGADTALTAVSTSIAMPALLEEVAMPDPVAATAAGGVSLLPVLRAGRRQAEEQYRHSPVAYLFAVREQLEPKTLLGRVRDVIRRLFTGV